MLAGGQVLGDRLLTDHDEDDHLAVSAQVAQQVNELAAIQLEYLHDGLLVMAEEFCSTGLVGRQESIQYGGAGTPRVPEFAVCQVQAEYGESAYVAQALVADTMSLIYRLPQVFGVFRAGHTTLGRARMVASGTRNLSLAQVGRVDDLLGCSSSGQLWDAGVTKISRRRLRQVIEQACATDDDEAESLEDQIAAALSERSISLRPGIPGVAEIIGTLSVADAARVNQRLAQISGWLAETGDTRALHELRSVALGMVADPGAVQALWLRVKAHRAGQPLLPDDEPMDEPFAEEARQAEQDLAAQLDAGSDCGRTGGTGFAMPATVLYLHLDRSTATWALEGHGTLTEREAADLVGHSNVKIQPVIDLAAELTYTGYQAPHRLREQHTLLNAGSCTFPHCDLAARGGDYDHIVPHPRGPTSTSNGQLLCRRHHRLKTHGDGWTVTSPTIGTWIWTSPDHHTWLVTAGTTTRLD